MRSDVIVLKTTASSGFKKNRDENQKPKLANTKKSETAAEAEPDVVVHHSQSISLNSVYGKNGKLI